MIHEIEPFLYDNDITSWREIEPEDIIFYFIENQVWLIEGEYPTFGDLVALAPSYSQNGKLQYCFQINNQCYYLLYGKDHSILPLSGVSLTLKPISTFHSIYPKYKAFAGLCGFHYYQWYNTHRFCGKCGSVLETSFSDRSVICSECQQFYYPSISPAVIVGVIYKEKLLLTKYVKGIYDHYSLVSGYIEVGETPEKAAKREVLEETGLQIKNLVYFDSQPWGFSGSLLLGFFAEVEGEPEIKIQESELKMAEWFSPEEIDQEDEDFSLANKMIMYFKSR
jgi:NAD+ diphosphatase